MSRYFTRTGEPMTLMQWALEFESHDNHVAEDLVDGVRVSTVWLGLDHSFGGPVPLIFETMVFGGPNDEFCARYSTEQQAREGHTRTVAAIRAGESL